MALSINHKIVMEDAKLGLGDRFYREGFTSAEQMLTEVRAALTVVPMEAVNAMARREKPNHVLRSAAV